MFAQSTTLYHDLPTSHLKQVALDSSYLSQGSMVLSRQQLAYLYYLEISLTKLQNYSLCEYPNSFDVPKSEKKQQQQNREINH